MLSPNHRIEPAPGQESVWDYPRPPAVQATSKQIQIEFNGVLLVDTRRSQRVLETSHPPVYYIPPEDIQFQYLTLAHRTTFCEWKGVAGYYTLQVGGQIAEQSAWFYSEPTDRFAAIRNYVAFYPSRMDACWVDGERVQSQPGDYFYGGWITSEIVGPFKGDPGTWGW